MRGVDLNQFDFDYDLTWVGFFLNAEGKIYGRYGGRDDSAADHYLTLPGLKYAMRQALDAYRRAPGGAGPVAFGLPPRTAEQYPAAIQVNKKGACIHCHQVYNFSRAQMRQTGQWKLDMVWVYPPPETVGISIDPEQGNRVSQVAGGSPASKAGIAAGDVLRTVGGAPVNSYLDLQYALNRSPASGQAPVTWERRGKAMRAALALAEGWKKNDISWRTSMWDLEPAACVHGEDLKPEEKKALDLAPEALAFRQGKFVPKPSREAGIREGDIILGADEKPLTMSMRQFNTWVRLNYKPGQTITYDVLRGGQRMKVPMVLPAKASF